MSKKVYLFAYLLLSGVSAVCASFYFLSAKELHVYFSTKKETLKEAVIEQCSAYHWTLREPSSSFFLDFLFPSKKQYAYLSQKRQASVGQLWLFTYVPYLPAVLKEKLFTHKACDSLLQDKWRASFAIEKNASCQWDFKLLTPKVGCQGIRASLISVLLSSFSLSTLAFAFAFLPLFLGRPREKGAFLELFKDKILLSLLFATGAGWLIYSYNLADEAHFFSSSISLKLLIVYLIYSILGYIAYASVVCGVWVLVQKRSVILRFFVVLLVLTGVVILIVQAIFLNFTSALLSSSYFNMLTRENISLFLTWPVILSIVFFLAGGLWLISRQRVNQESYLWLWRFIPSVALAVFCLTLANIGLLYQRSATFYRPNQVTNRLAFCSYFDPLLSFAQEFIHCTHSRFYPHLYSLGIQKLVPSVQETAESYSLNLGEEGSTFPAGHKPFKRIILITIEGYRLAYVPQYNPALQDIVLPFPFFSRPEVQQARKQHYYACTAFTTRALKAIFLSHLNTDTSNFYLEAIQEYPSLGAQLKKAGFTNLFIRTASRGFDQFGVLFKAMGMDKVFEMKDLEFISSKDYQEIDLKIPNAWAYPSRLLFKEVIGQLKKAKNNNEPIFALVLNTDTHNPPKGMAMVNPANYGQLSYPYPLVCQEDTISRTLKNTLISTYRFAYDLDLFFEQLKHEGLWDEDTLLIITADHSQNSPDPKRLANSTQHKLFEELPLFILTPRPLAKLNQDTYATHLDLAPTILDLMGLNKPAGYWGRSLYSSVNSKGKAWFSYTQGILYSKDAYRQKSWLLDEHSKLKTLWQNLYIK